jgi:hypothetical protein
MDLTNGAILLVVGLGPVLMLVVSRRTPVITVAELLELVNTPSRGNRP